MSEQVTGSILVIAAKLDEGEEIRSCLADAGFSAHVTEAAEYLAAARQPLDGIVLAPSGLDRLGEIARTLSELDEAMPLIVLGTLAQISDESVRERVDDVVGPPFDPEELRFRVHRRVRTGQRLRAFAEGQATAERTAAEAAARKLHHKLNQPLSVILGFGELIQDERQPAEKRLKMAMRIAQAGQQLASAIESLARPAIQQETV